MQQFNFKSPLARYTKLILVINFIISTSTVLAESQSIESKVCQKDSQIRMVSIKKDNEKHITVFHKQEEAIISGRFDTLAAAQESLVEVQIELEKIGWKCRPANVSYIFE